MTAPNVNTSALRTLHRIHRQLSDLREQQQRGPKQVRAAETHCKYQEEQLAKLEEESKRIRMAADAKHVQLKACEEKVKDLQGKLNTASSNREYQALKDQIAALKGREELPESLHSLLEQHPGFHTTDIPGQKLLFSRLGVDEKGD